MNYYSMTAQETLKALGTDLAHGLTPEQAEEAGRICAL